MVYNQPKAPHHDQMNYRRICAVPLAALCAITYAQTSHQPPQPNPEIKISVASTKDPNTYTVSLRNVSQHGLSVVLGEGCSGSSKDITSITYRLSNYMMVSIDFVELGRPCAGNLRVVMADLAPGERYTYEMQLDDTTLFGDENLVRAVSAGKYSYKLQALVDGQKAIDDEKWLGDFVNKAARFPLWHGHAVSDCVPFPSPKSSDWQSYAQRGGSIKAMVSRLCAANQN
jgi:hypothetical protein